MGESDRRVMAERRVIAAHLGGQNTRHFRWGVLSPKTPHHWIWGVWGVFDLGCFGRFLKKNHPTIIHVVYIIIRKRSNIFFTSHTYFWGFKPPLSISAGLHQFKDSKTIILQVQLNTYQISSFKDKKWSNFKAQVCDSPDSYLPGISLYRNIEGRYQ